MRNILIISEHIQEINRVRRLFGSDYKISATNSAPNALNMLQTKTADLVIYHAGGDYAGVFELYKLFRQNAATENLPLILVTEASFIHALEDKVELQKAVTVSIDIEQDALMDIVEALLE
jgi:PleD family two-component response regulator